MALPAYLIFCALAAGCQPPDDPAAAPASLTSTDQFQATADDLGPRQEMPGAPLYAEHCASCHAGGVSRAPHLIWLEMMTPQILVASMTDGIMRPQAAHLNAEQRIQIAEYLSRARYDTETPAAAAPSCIGEAAQFDLSRPVPRVGWGHDTARFVNAETAQLATADIGKLKLKWAFAFPNALRARSHPAIAMGAVFVGSQDGTVYAFDLETGCERWSFQASAEVRTGIVLSAWEPSTVAPIPEGAMAQGAGQAATPLPKQARPSPSSATFWPSCTPYTP